LVVDQYQVLDLRPLELDAAARRGDTITLVLGGQRLRLRLQPKNLVAAGCTIVQLADQPVTTPCPTDLGTYAGGIVDRTGWSQARLSITAQGVIGAIRTNDVTWVIEPLRVSGAALPAGTVRHMAYRTGDMKGQVFFEGNRTDSVITRQHRPVHSGWGTPEAMRRNDDFDRRGCDPEDRPCQPPPKQTGPPAAPLSLRTLGIAFAADHQFVDQARLGTAFIQRQAAVLNMVDGMYRRESIGTFQIAVVIADPTDRFFGSNDSSILLDAILPAFTAANLDLNVPANRVARGVSTAFLTSGKPPDGIILGIARQPGINGLAFQDMSYSLDTGTAAAKTAQNWMVMAHELGHIYNGAHEEADWFCRFYFFFCLNPAHTIMWPSYNFRTSPEFSHGLIDITHNNASRLRTNIPSRTP
jgi:hypothetical protein